MKYSATSIASIINGRLLQQGAEEAIAHLVTDSRKVYVPETSLFFALKGARRDGHLFIHELYRRGVRNFVISKLQDPAGLEEANIIRVEDTLEALQKLAAHHRRQFTIPVIGITGSNGKTIVKEWLYQLLHHRYNIVRSPKSYNSQIGVPLSVWEINSHHELAIFEAGISKPGEMERLEQIIQPTIGILTNIGEAHSENFVNREEKLKEKLKLFQHANKVIARGDDAWITRQIIRNDFNYFFWGRNADCDLQIHSIETATGGTGIRLSHAGDFFTLHTPFTDEGSIENVITCCAVLLVAGVERTVIEERIPELVPVTMRLELMKGINQCSLINDSYSADLDSLAIALNFLDQQNTSLRRTVILSDFLQTGLQDEKLYAEISALLASHRIARVIGVGRNIMRYLQAPVASSSQFYATTDEFLQQFRSSQFREEVILVKGARIFEFEKIVHALEQKVHQTVLEVNLNAIVHNLNQYQQLLSPTTRVMAMVKAFAYGSGGAEIAGILQFHKVDYLGVAYADEGVELRRAGINLPVMIMNPEEYTFDSIIENNLEPDIYSFGLLEKLDDYLVSAGLQEYPVHIELESGMNRLGFEPSSMQRLVMELTKNNSFKVVSVFSHLAGSEDPAEDEFTMQQFRIFTDAAAALQNGLGYRLIRHIANSAAIVRQPSLQMDMVRLGIGMYGIDSSGSGKVELQPVAELKSTIAQLKNVAAGEAVSYNRTGRVQRDSIIATVRIGYADGYSRRLGNGVGKMLVNGRPAPVIGTVCMDMTMIDVTDIEGVKEGDEVIVFGKDLPLQQLADWAGTIPYEMMTGISQRVKRIYFEE